MRSQNDYEKLYYKKVEGRKGEHCFYPTRLDTYGCGCAHDCKYCYAKTILDFRKNWNANNPKVADPKRIEKILDDMVGNGFVGRAVRLGGMTDCFQPIERVLGVTLKTIKMLNERHIPYLIVTKSDLIADDIYINAMDKELAHIQISLTHTNDEEYKLLDYEKAPLPSRRIKAIEKLQEHGFDVQVRLSPFIPEFIDFDILNSIKCDKILVEFLRVNSWVRKWFNISYSQYSVHQGAYDHLPLYRKLEYLKNITGFKRVTVCDSEDKSYLFWKHHFNPNPYDCCDLRL